MHVDKCSKDVRYDGRMQDVIERLIWINGIMEIKVLPARGSHQRLGAALRLTCGL